MTKLKCKPISSLMHLFIIITIAIVCAGFVVGMLCQFLGNGYFAYGDDYASYRSVSVNYAFIDTNSDFGETEVKKICTDTFSAQGVDYYTVTTAETSAGGLITYKFSTYTDKEKLEASVTAIATELSTHGVDSDLTTVSYNEANTLQGGLHDFAMAAIAVSAAIVFQFIYMTFRYRFTMALGAFLADIHNLVIFLSLLALTRIPISTSITLFAVLTVVITMIGCVYLFDKIKKYAKSDDGKTLPSFDKVDNVACESAKGLLILNACLAVGVLLIAAIVMLGALQASLVTPLLLSIFTFASCFYGTACFTPAVYTRFLKIAEDRKAKQKAYKAVKTPAVTED